MNTSFGGALKLPVFRGSTGSGSSTTAVQYASIVERPLNKSRGSEVCGEGEARGVSIVCLRVNAA